MPRLTQVAQLALLLSFVVPAAAVAGPVTGQTAIMGDAQNAPPPADGRESEQTQSSADAFSAGALFDGIGMPLLRLSAPIYLELPPHAKLRALGGEGGEAGGDGGGGDSGSSGGDPGIGNVGIQVSTGPSGLGPTILTPIPEPATLALLAPAVFLAVRRRIRQKRTHS
jgi:hypothetical protein